MSEPPIDPEPDPPVDPDPEPDPTEEDPMTVETLPDLPPDVTELARRMKVDVAVPGAGGELDWVPLFGITTLTAPLTATNQASNTYESDGWAKNVKTMQAWALNATVERQRSAAGQLQAGQQVVYDAHDQFGADNIVAVRWYDREGGDEAFSGYAMVAWEDQGGAADAIGTANITLTGQGKRYRIANPDAA